MANGSPEQSVVETTTRAQPPAGINREVLFEAVLSNFEHLGLVPSEARILLALLRHVSATAPQLASSAGVPRTSVYPVLESLKAKRLAARLPGDGPAVWTPATDHEALVDRLIAGYIERLNQLQQRAAQLKDALRMHFPQGKSLDTASVHVLSGPIQAKQVFDRLLNEASREVIMSGWPPYADTQDGFNPALGHVLTRQVSARLLYQQDHLDAQGPLPRAISSYQRAGLRIRVTDQNIVKSVVADSSAALVGLSTGSGLESGSLTSLLIESADYATAQAKAFEYYWENARDLSIEAP